MQMKPGKPHNANHADAPTADGHAVRDSGWIDQQIAHIAFPVVSAADLQDHLMTATNDLDRLQTLLTHACDTLLEGFYGASEEIRALREAHVDKSDLVFDQTLKHLGDAVTALQFHDMATQLIAHTHRRLRNCADRLARDAFAEDEDGETIVEEPPLRPNPVTQSEMEAGSVELF
jgi:hypothetical protein